MPVTVKLRYLRIAPRKVRLVADLIRKKKVEEAQTVLNFVTKKAALPLLKLLKSAIANAKNNFGLEGTNLYISKITVDEGSKLKRWRSRARGRASEIQKKTSHVTIVLEEIEKKPKEVKKLKKVKKVKKEIPKIKKPALPKPRPEKEIKKPKIERGIKKIFRRKAF
ncbi:50S ribosomal protein L22 [Patescibacteria group bacterium]|nr:50S ribosomal protein L22 [Patescibacteria group bacterium]